MARGRKPKAKQIPKEVVEVVGDDIIQVITGSHDNIKLDKEVVDAAEAWQERQDLNKVEIVRAKCTFKDWDVKIGDKIDYFDPELSYELTGYRPITETKGLDFNPNWFTEARETKIKSGHYCHKDSGKVYNDFWDTQFDRCNYGHTVNGYTLTGDQYFFLNFYQLQEVSGTEVAADGRPVAFPSFFSKQYEYFHYIRLCEFLKKDVCALKARGVGFSEIAASLGVRLYTTKRNMNVLYTTFNSSHLEDVLDKCWTQLDFLNMETEGGLRHLRQKKNSTTQRRASLLNKQGEEYGWKSQISGVVADNPRKLRGARVDRLLFEEAGSNSCLVKSYLQSNPLVEILGNKFGTRFVWGTGGDSGPALEGLAGIFNNPDDYNVLPYRHNHTKSGEFVITSFFIPAYTFVATAGIIDKRGVTNIEKAKAHYLKKRAPLAVNDPKAYIIECAEYCFTPDDALALEGDNNFNREALIEQKTRIQVYKDPTSKQIETGRLEYKYEGEHRDENVKGFQWDKLPSGKVKILEHPRRNEHGYPLRNLYVAGIDSIDMGQSETSEATKDPSHFCIVIKRRQHGLDPPQYVAIYKDRPDDIREAYRIAERLLEYYNCQAVLEFSKINFKSFLEGRKKARKLLMRRTRATLASNTSKANQYGVPATLEVIHHYLALLESYVNDYCSEIWFVEMLDELTTYSIQNKRKFDIVAAMGMCELGDEELRGVTPVSQEEMSETWQDIGFYIDSKGIRRRGVIPKKLERDVIIKEEYDDTRIRTSDPRVFYYNQ